MIIKVQGDRLEMALSIVLFKKYGWVDEDSKQPVLDDLKPIEQLSDLKTLSEDKINELVKECASDMVEQYNFAIEIEYNEKKWENKAHIYEHDNYLSLIDVEINIEDNTCLFTVEMTDDKLQTYPKIRDFSDFTWYVPPQLAHLKDDKKTINDLSIKMESSDQVLTLEKCNLEIGQKWLIEIWNNGFVEELYLDSIDSEITKSLDYIHLRVKSFTINKSSYIIYEEN